MGAHACERPARFLTGLLQIFLAVSIGCGVAPTGGPPTNAERRPIVHPVLDGTEPLVRERLETARAALEAIVTAGTAQRDELAAAFGETGMLYHAHGFLDAADACYGNAEALAPRDFRWPYYLAHAHLKAGDPQRAAEGFRRALAIAPGSIPALVRLADLEVERNVAEAEALYRRALAVDPGCAEAELGLGKVAAQSGDFAAAVRHLEAALKLRPDAAEIHYRLGIAYRNLGQLDVARAHLAAKGSQLPGLADPWIQQLEALAAGWRLHLQRGTALFRDARYQQALEEFRRAATATSGEALIHVNIGSTLMMLGDRPGAFREFERALEIEPENQVANFNLGTLSAGLGEDERAIGFYRAALDANADLLDAHFNMANALRRLGRFAEALPHYRRVVDADPRNGAARVGEAFSLVRLDRHREALARLEDGSAALPDDGLLRNGVVRLLAASPDPAVRDGARALALAQALLDQDSSLPNVEAFAMAAAEAGRFDLAVTWQQRAIDAVKSAGRVELLPELERNRLRYSRREPCRQPWGEKDPGH